MHLLRDFHTNDFCVFSRSVDQLQSLPELSYHGLGLLCSTIHGEGDEVGGVTPKRPLRFSCMSYITLLDLYGCCILQCRRRVFRKLLYVIIMMKTQERSKPCLLAPSQTVCGARDQAILFIRLVTAYSILPEIPVIIHVGIFMFLFLKLHAISKPFLSHAVCSALIL